MKQWRNKLEQQQSNGLWRTHQVRQGPQPAKMNFNSNDYFGLSNHPDVISAFKKAADQYGVGAGSANTLSGYTQAHDDLRQSLRDWLGRDDVLLFSSGYQANMALLSTLVAKTDHVYADKLNHASLIDGMLFSGATFTRYPHLNLEALQRSLSKHTNETNQKWVVTESVFSMEGDAIDCLALSQLCQKNHATLIIDEAHSLGLYGPQGAGWAAAHGVTQEQAPLIIGTFGKSIGTQGAFIAGDKLYIDTLMQFARPYLFTTAMAPALAAASNAAIALLRKADAQRQHIDSLVHYFREQAQALNFTIGDSLSPIQPLYFKEIEQVNRLSAALNKKDIAVSSIRYPTVALDAPRLRMTLTAQHNINMIDEFFRHLKEALDEEAPHTNSL